MTLSNKDLSVAFTFAHIANTDPMLHLSDDATGQFIAN